MQTLESKQLNLVFPEDMTESEVTSQLVTRLPIETTNDLYAALITFKNSILTDLHKQGLRLISSTELENLKAQIDDKY